MTQMIRMLNEELILFLKVQVQKVQIERKAGFDGVLISAFQIWVMLTKPRFHSETDVQFVCLSVWLFPASDFDHR